MSSHRQPPFASILIMGKWLGGRREWMQERSLKDEASESAKSEIHIMFLKRNICQLRIWIRRKSSIEKRTRRTCEDSSIISSNLMIDMQKNKTQLNMKPTRKRWRKPKTKCILFRILRITIRLKMRHEAQGHLWSPLQSQTLKARSTERETHDSSFNLS